MHETGRSGVGPTSVPPRFETKRCPECGQQMFADMDVCFECLHSFVDSSDAMVPTGSWDEDVVPTDAYGLGEEMVEEGDPIRHAVRLSNALVDVTVPIPRRGLVIGRGTSCDVVLHERSVSRRHLGIQEHDGVVTASDLGAKNQATLNGRPVGQGARLAIDDELRVCGMTITLVDASLGVRPSENPFT